MLRRRFLSSFSLAAPSALLLSSCGQASKTAGPRTADSEATRVGTLDLAQLPIIDVHNHPPAEETHSQMNEEWMEGAIDSLIPAGDYPGKSEYRARVADGYRQHVFNNPEEVGLRDYMARTYGVEPTAEGVDSVSAPHIGKDFPAYIRSIMDREKITGILLQSASTEPVRPVSLIPDERMRWTYSINHLLYPDWAQKQSLATPDDAVSRIHKVLEQCVSNECVGFKLSVAYFRPLQFDNVSSAQIKNDFSFLRAIEPPIGPARDAGGRGKVQDFNPETRRALKSYQDYMFKQICLKAGELKAKIIIHTAVALHPVLRSDFNDPAPLYHLFLDGDVRRAETEFVLIHSGYPHHEQVALFLNQFPNVYTDLSFYPSYPGVLENVLRTFLAFAPSEKIMYGNDWSPEMWGYCAFNLRRVLARVLNDYRNIYGWSQKSCDRMARNVMSENAKRIYGFRT